MIEFDRVVKYYGTHRALDGVSFTVPDGCVTVLIGPSGCGKSTSLKLVNRLLEPDDGYVRVNGRPVKSFAVEELRRGIGYVIQSAGLLPHMTVQDNIGLVPRLLGRDKAWRRARARDLLDLIGLDPHAYARKYPSQLSGGEAQRVGVARALAADPPILLMDEPFGAVDPLNRETLQNEFISLQRKLKKTVIFVTHDLDEAVRVADRIVLLQDGLVIQEAAPEELLGRPSNAFARDFVGTDRALKRLGRFSVSDYMSHDTRRVGTKDHASVPVDATLREALSRILAIPSDEISVIDAQNRTLGSISLEAIRRAGCGGESS